MIAEIGVMIGLYLLARLVPSSWKRSAKILSVLAGVVVLLVIVDLGLRLALGDAESLASVLRPSRAEEAVEEAEAEEELGEAAQKEAFTTSTRADGGRITTQLGYGIAIAKNSSLHREWIAVHDSRLPVDLEGTPGVTTAYVRGERYSRGEYRYRADLKLTTSQPLRALEVRFLTFDVWGDHVRTLSYSEVRDIPEGAARETTAEWMLYSENEVEEHYASIAYVATVRLEDGRVLHAAEQPVLEEARRFSEKFTAEDLEPSGRAESDEQET